MKSRSSSVGKLRAATQDASISGSQIVLRQSVLRGAFASSAAFSQWRCPSFKLVVFVSSTFTDTTLERNYLLDELLFELREKGAAHGMSTLQLYCVVLCCAMPCCAMLCFAILCHTSLCCLLLFAFPVKDQWHRNNMRLCCIQVYR